MTDYKNKNLQKLLTPKYFFVTFRTEEAYLLANKTFEGFKYKGDDITIHEAIEPTDMIWENRHFTNTERIFRRMVVLLIMAILTFGAFLLMVYLIKIKLRVSFNKQSPGLDCANIIDDRFIANSITADNFIGDSNFVDDAVNVSVQAVVSTKNKDEKIIIAQEYNKSMR